MRKQAPLPEVLFKETANAKNPIEHSNAKVRLLAKEAAQPKKW